MIIVKLQGGLGNQMFQYALARNLSLLHGVPFKIDSSYLQQENQSGRTFRLDGFWIHAEEAPVAEIRQYLSPLQKMLDRLRPVLKRKKVLEQTGGFNSLILTRGSGYFDGHWNSEKYFAASEKTIRNDFTLKNPFGPAAEKITREIELSKNPTSIHIRRGDYVTIEKIAKVHGALPFSYYEKAIQKILETASDAHFFIFSDDINWVKENFPKNYPVTFVSSPDIPDYEELILMSRCAHNIIANSTFSWWGAWLNANPGKIVITPKHWFTDPTRVIQDLIPQSWLQI